MTLLTVCENVAEDVGLIKPATIISNTETTAVRLLRAAQREGKFLSRVNHDWRVLTKEHKFNLAANTSAYSLPSDFYRFVNRTQWDRTNNWELKGPLNPQEWQWLKSAVTDSGPRRRFRLRPNTTQTLQIQVSPVPTAIVSAQVFEYISDQWVKGAANSAKNQWAVDTDVAVFDEYLLELGVKWRVLRMLGLAYFDDKMEYEREFNMAIAADGGSPDLDLTGEPIEEAVNIADANFPTS